MNRLEATLIVIAKSPRPGHVKTRLCPPLTSQEAALVAGAALADTLENAIAVEATRHLLVLDGPPGPWIPPGFDVVAQRGTGLAARLTHAFTLVRGPALLIGMDTPQVTAPALHAAIVTLLAPDVDAVLGRADDGGYWAIGGRFDNADVFNGVPMSTIETHAVQRARLDALGYRIRDLDVQRDVDTFDDAVAVAAAVPDSRFARVLHALGVMPRGTSREPLLACVGERF